VDPTLCAFGVWSLEFGLESGYCVPGPAHHQGLLHRAAPHSEKISFANFPSFVINCLNVGILSHFVNRQDRQSLQKLNHSYPHALVPCPSLHSHTRSGPEKTETRHQQNSPFAHSTPNPSTSKPVSQVPVGSPSLFAAQAGSDPGCHPPKTLNHFALSPFCNLYPAPSPPARPSHPSTSAPSRSAFLDLLLLHFLPVSSPPVAATISVPGHFHLFPKVHLLSLD
jgi:hypothetical protein